jgi:hypothetical protein
MGSLRRVELTDDDSERRTQVLMPELLREMYRCGIELAANESAVFQLAASPDRSLTLVVRNGRDGVVDVQCSDDRVAAELRGFIGFHVVLTSEDETARTVHRRRQRIGTTSK